MLRTIYYYVLPAALVVYFAKRWCAREGTYQGTYTIRPFHGKGVIVLEESEGE